jgi:phosphoribosyl-AMP cyclohydrolase
MSTSSGETSQFLPLFNESGLITCVTVDAVSHGILMVAYMNQEALQETLRTGRAVYYSRSRKKLWRKGEESGNYQEVKELRVDCDQDCLQLLVTQIGGAACHTGRNSCFYRRVKPGQLYDPIKSGQFVELEFIDQNRLFDPNQVYGKTGAK